MNPATVKFIKDLLSSTLQLDFHYFQYPYTDISPFDRSLRNSLKNSDELYNQVQQLIPTLEHNHFHFITDKYDINYIFFYPYQNKKDIVSIGPFFNKAINDEYWVEISRTNHLDPIDIHNLLGFLYKIPVFANNLHLHSIISNIISYINVKDTPSFSIKYHNYFSEQDHSNSYIPKDDFEAYSNMIFSTYKIEQKLLQSISMGNYKEALLIAEEFMNTHSEPFDESSLRYSKSLVITANTLFRKAVETNEIHPIYLHEISAKFINLIEYTTSFTALYKLYEKMIREYCLLVRTKSTKNYSTTIRKILYYIEFNLNMPLTLKGISERSNLSEPYLSKLFKKEVGTTMIKYISQLRIQSAIKLLDTTPLSIQDIASYVGINDCNYFTKVFKNETGITPSEYRKNLLIKTNYE